MSAMFSSLLVLDRHEYSSLAKEALINSISRNIAS